MSALREFHDAGRSVWAAVFYAVIAMLLALVGWHVLFIHLPNMVVEESNHRLLVQSIEIVLLLGPAAILLYAGLRLRDHRIADRYRSVSIWMLGGMGLFVGVAASLRIHRLLLGYDLNPSLLQKDLLTAIGAGGVLGLAVGVNRATVRARTAEIEANRDAMAFLNHVLRHKILNDSQVIDGFLRRVEAETELDEAIDRIRERNEATAEVVHDIRTILETYESGAPLRPIDVTATVRSEVQQARSSHPSVEIVTAIESGVTAECTNLIRVVVSNLIENAVVHHDRPNPTVEVNVSMHTNHVQIEIADDGPGISEERKRDVIEPGSRGDRGYGLFLVERIIEQSGGNLVIDDNYPRGTVVTIELAKA